MKLIYYVPLWIDSKGIFNSRQTRASYPYLVRGKHLHRSHLTSPPTSPAHYCVSKERDVPIDTKRLWHISKSRTRDTLWHFSCITVISPFLPFRVSIPLLQAPMLPYFTLKNIPINQLYQAFSLKLELQKAGVVSFLYYIPQTKIINMFYRHPLIKISRDTEREIWPSEIPNQTD